MRRSLAFAVVLLGCAGCVAGSGDRVWGSQTIAITLDAGRPEVLVYTCAGGGPASTVEITVHDVHSSTDKVLWQVRRISSDRPAAETVERIAIGGMTTGYRTVQPLGDLPAGSLDVSVDRSRPSGVFTFKTSELKAGTLRVDRSWYDWHRSVDEAEFLRVNRENCR